MIRVIAGLCLITIVATYEAQQDKSKHGVQAKPDLSGTWVLVQSNNSVAKSQRQQDITDYVLTIVQRDPEIRITKKYKKRGREYMEEWIYYTDGRQEILPESENIEAQTKWRGRKLYRRITVKRSFPFRSIPEETVTQEEWEISEDGTLLTRTINRSTLGRPGRSDSSEPLNEKYVFRRT
jgi:hypothetical protein